MSISLDVTTNAIDIVNKLNKFQSRGIFVAMSKAEQRSVDQARKKAQKSMKETLHKPAKQTVNSIRREFRQKAKIKAGVGDSKVFISDFLVEELWPVTVTETGNPRKEETATPKSGDHVLVPTKRFRDSVGSIKGLRRNKQILSKLRKSDRYFEVGFNSRIRAKNGGFLKPGLYEVRKLKRGQRIRLLIEYKERRKIIPKWKFREVVRGCYDKQYPIEIRKAMLEELEKLF